MGASPPARTPPTSPADPRTTTPTPTVALPAAVAATAATLRALLSPSTLLSAPLSWLPLLPWLLSTRARLPCVLPNQSMGCVYGTPPTYHTVSFLRSTALGVKLGGVYIFCRLLL